MPALSVEIPQVLGANLKEAHSFNDIQEKTETVVLGWVRDGDLVVNPKDKDKKFTWAKDDQLILCSS